MRDLNYKHLHYFWVVAKEGGVNRAANKLGVAAQTISGQHIEITEAGVRLRPWLVRYASPAELDAMAAAAGLVLVERHADWHGAPFQDASDHHVSVYRRPS